jgi:hypothetical protein
MGWPFRAPGLLQEPCGPACSVAQKGFGWWDVGPCHDPLPRHQISRILACAMTCLHFRHCNHPLEEHSHTRSVRSSHPFTQHSPQLCISIVTRRPVPVNSHSSLILTLTDHHSRTCSARAHAHAHSLQFPVLMLACHSCQCAHSTHSSTSPLSL